MIRKDLPSEVSEVCADVGKLPARKSRKQKVFNDAFIYCFDICFRTVETSIYRVSFLLARIFPSFFRNPETTLYSIGGRSNNLGRHTDFGTHP